MLVHETVPDIFSSPCFCGSNYFVNIVGQVSIMFVTLEKIAQTDLKYSDIFLLENYAAFQNRYSFFFSRGNFIRLSTYFFFPFDVTSAAVACSLYDLANVVPTLAKFYHQASEAYEQACTRHISMIIYYVINSSSFIVFPASDPVMKH